MAPSVNCLGRNSCLKILCATEENKLVGIAPLRITHMGLKGHFGYNIIEPLTNGDTDYTGLIMTKKQDLCLNQFLAHLFSQKDWDLMYLPDLPQTSPSLALITKAADIPKFEIEKGVICPYIAIPDSKEKLLASLSRKFGKKLRKSITKLEREHGRVELKNYLELGSLEQAIQILIDLHQKRWTSRGNSGRFLKKESRDITLQTARYFAEKDWLRLYFLTINDKPVAVELNLEYKGKMYCHLKGFDTNYYKYRVGSLLTLKVLEKCVEKGITEYDLMQGDEAYKFDWTSKYRQNINLKWVNEKFSSKILDSGLKVLKKSKFDKLFYLLNRLHSSKIGRVLGWIRIWESLG
jgi:CelD/BcsL family acetyltransferase involved in cellulose biosynthesis